MPVRTSAWPDPSTTSCARIDVSRVARSTMAVRLVKEGLQRRGESREVDRIAGERYPQTRLESRTTGEVTHENSHCAESVTDERRPLSEVGEDEVCLRLTCIHATRAEELTQQGSLAANLGHVSAQRCVATTQL